MQHLGRIVWKKVAQGTDDPEAIGCLLERHISLDQPRKVLLNELVSAFTELGQSLKHDPPAPPPSLPRIIQGFQQFARKAEIPPDELCSSLIEGMILHAHHEDGTRTAPKPSTQEKILDAALEVFSHKGFHVATVDEIAERAGVGKGTLYRYFSNKETLFNELVRLRLEELERDANAALNDRDNVLTMIAKYLRVYFEFFDRNQRLYRVIVQERLDVGKQVQDLYVKKVMRRLPALKRKVYEASQQGVFKDVDFQTVFYGVMGFSHGVIQKWLARECSYSLVEELPTVLEVLFYGFVKDSQSLPKRVP